MFPNILQTAPVNMYALSCNKSARTFLNRKAQVPPSLLHKPNCQLQLAKEKLAILSVSASLHQNFPLHCKPQ